MVVKIPKNLEMKSLLPAPRSRTSFSLPVASDNSLTFRGGSSSAALVDVSSNVRGKCDLATASAASVECV
jgi:hypothetical protein